MDGTAQDGTARLVGILTDEHAGELPDDVAEAIAGGPDVLLAWALENAAYEFLLVDSEEVLT